MADINDWEEYEKTTQKLEKTNINNNFESEDLIKPKETKPQVKDKKEATTKIEKKELETEKKENDDNKQGLLANEKDFVDLAVLSVAKIKDANKLSKFTMSYLKKNIEELTPTIETARIDELIKNLTVLFNKKRKEESEKYGKKPKNKQPSLASGKAMDAATVKGKLDVYEDDAYSDEDYGQDDFM